MPDILWTSLETVPTTKAILGGRIHIPIGIKTQATKAERRALDRWQKEANLFAADVGIKTRLVAPGTFRIYLTIYRTRPLVRANPHIDED